ncbi:hypothetical protein Bca4012_065534 [Brassica carinata]
MQLMPIIIDRCRQGHKLISLGSRNFFLCGRKENGGLVRSGSPEQRIGHIYALPKPQKPQFGGGATVIIFEVSKKEREVGHYRGTN